MRGARAALDSKRAMRAQPASYSRPCCCGAGSRDTTSARECRGMKRKRAVLASERPRTGFPDPGPKSPQGAKTGRIGRPPGIVKNEEAAGEIREGRGRLGASRNQAARCWR